MNVMLWRYVPTPVMHWLWAGHFKGRRYRLACWIIRFPHGGAWARMSAFPRWVRLCLTLSASAR
jgi:hypothetical protein